MPHVDDTEGGADDVVTDVDDIDITMPDDDDGQMSDPGGVPGGGTAGSGGTPTPTPEGTGADDVVTDPSDIDITPRSEVDRGGNGGTGGGGGRSRPDPTPDTQPTSSGDSGGSRTSDGGLTDAERREAARRLEERESDLSLIERGILDERDVTVRPESVRRTGQGFGGRFALTASGRRKLAERSVRGIGDVAAVTGVETLEGGGTRVSATADTGATGTFIFPSEGEPITLGFRPEPSGRSTTPGSDVETIQVPEEEPGPSADAERDTFERVRAMEAVPEAFRSDETRILEPDFASGAGEFEQFRVREPGPSADAERDTLNRLRAEREAPDERGAFGQAFDILTTDFKTADGREITGGPPSIITGDGTPNIPIVFGPVAAITAPIGTELAKTAVGAGVAEGAIRASESLPGAAGRQSRRERLFDTLEDATGFGPESTPLAAGAVAGATRGASGGVGTIAPFAAGGLAVAAARESEIGIPNDPSDFLPTDLEAGGGRPTVDLPVPEDGSALTGSELGIGGGLDTVVEVPVLEPSQVSPDVIQAQRLIQRERPTERERERPGDIFRRGGADRDELDEILEGPGNVVIGEEQRRRRQAERQFPTGEDAVVGRSVSESDIFDDTLAGLEESLAEQTDFGMATESLAAEEASVLAGARERTRAAERSEVRTDRVLDDSLDGFTRVIEDQSLNIDQPQFVGLEQDLAQAQQFDRPLADALGFGEIAEEVEEYPNPLEFGEPTEPENVFPTTIGVSNVPVEEFDIGIPRPDSGDFQPTGFGADVTERQIVFEGPTLADFVGLAGVESGGDRRAEDPFDAINLPAEDFDFEFDMEDLL